MKKDQVVHEYREHIDFNDSIADMAGVTPGYAAIVGPPSNFQTFSTDGVGTKSSLASFSWDYFNLGVDLVAMSANDVLCTGAYPKYFMDYIALGGFNEKRLASILAGVKHGCSQAGCTLIGGETAEMKGVMPKDSVELSGFCVGEGTELLSSNNVQEGDKIVGLTSSGFHANGYTVVRDLLRTTYCPEHVKAPTRLYTSAVKNLKARYDVVSLAHVTGGGMKRAVRRLAPDNLYVDLDHDKLYRDDSSRWALRQGMNKDDMYGIFNCGYGMLVAVRNYDEEDYIGVVRKGL